MTKPIDPAGAVAEMRAAGFEPLVPYPGRTGMPWECRCLTCGRTAFPCLTRVRNNNLRCGFCKHVDPAEAVTEMRVAGLEPLVPYPGADAPWRCRCLKCGEEVQPSYRAATNRSTACRFCSAAGRRKPFPADEAVALIREAGVEPLEDFPGQYAPWRCRCTVCGKEVVPRLYLVRRGGGGCRFCTAKRRGQAARATKLANAVPSDASEIFAVMRAAGFEPLGPYPGSGTPWRCRCAVCGKESTPRYDTVKRGSRCRFCAPARIRQSWKRGARG